MSQTILTRRHSLRLNCFKAGAECPMMLGKEKPMNIWRMELRAGNHGPDMWPLCHECGIAAIIYEAIYDTDLSHLTKSDLDPKVRSSARSSIFRFAWEMKGGDEILVGDSKSKCIVARGG